jgi:uncharacterized protein YcnI
MRSLRTRATLVALVTAVTLLPATIAVAHPGLRPDELRPGETVAAELVVPHGCGNEGGMPEEGEVASPTTEIAVQWPDGIEVWPEEVDGWTTDVTDGVATWLDDGGATVDAILVPTTVSAASDLAGDVYVSVFQACENGESFRWVATPGEEGSPALRLTVAGDPVPQPTTTSTPADGPTPAGDTTTASPAPTATASEEVTVAPEPVAATASPAPVSEEREDAERASAFLVMALGLAVGVGVASVFIRRRRAAGADAGTTDAGGGR